MGEQGLILWPVGVKHCGYTLQISSVNKKEDTQKKKMNVGCSIISVDFY